MANLQEPFHITKNPEAVFLVDDDDAIRKNLSIMLEDLGYKVFSYADPDDFLASNQSYWPAVVVADMQLPKMSGLGMQKQLLANNCQTPIVFLSEANSVVESITAIKQGAVDLLLKPFQLPDLLRAIRQGIELDIKRLHERNDEIVRQEKLNNLNPREKQVCYLLIKGYEIGQIATNLNTSIDSAKQLKTNVLSKLGFDSLADLMNWLVIGLKPGTEALFDANQYLTATYSNEINEPNPTETISSELKVADLILNSETFVVTRGNKPIYLTPKEFTLLQALMLKAGKVISREYISETVWGEKNPTATNVVDVFVRQLRRKVDEDFNLKLIKTVRGFGYKLQE